jgi:hypothetical protein
MIKNIVFVATSVHRIPVLVVDIELYNLHTFKVIKTHFSSDHIMCKFTFKVIIQHFLFINFLDVSNV